MHLLVLGQSNVANHGKRLSHCDWGQYFHQGKKRRLVDPILGGSGKGGSVWTRLSPLLKQSGLTDEFIVSVLAQGGTSVSDWSSGGKCFEPFEKDHIPALKSGPTPVTHIIYHQGERDTLLETSRQDYIEAFKPLHKLLRKSFPDVPIFICTASYRFGICSDDVREAQKEISETFEGCVFAVDTDELGEAYRYDNTHFNDLGLNTFADALFKAFVPHIKERAEKPVIKNKVSPKPTPRPKTAARQERGRRISIACFPKSGSTFITKSLARYCDFPTAVIATTAEVQEISHERLKKADSLHPSFITQTHFHPTKHNLRMLKQYGMDSVFIYRNIFDCIVSLRDMYEERVEFGKGIWEGSFTSQWGYYNPNFNEMNQEEQFDYMIEGALSWYLLCFATWSKKINDEGYPAIVLSYEEFFSDVDKNFYELVDSLGLYDAEKASNFSLPKKESGAEGVRFNVGKVGRGRELLTKTQQMRIIERANIIEKGTGCSLSRLF